MDDDRCGEMHLLIQADVDGELTPSEAARAAEHVRTCPDCAALQTSMLHLSERLKQDVTKYQASPALRAALQARIAREQRPHVERTWSWRRLFGLFAIPSATFGGGFAIAAALALFMLVPRGALPDAIVAAHVRALQPGHLMDVVSTDQHTVKPWFDGRLPFAPPVKDLANIGFPLTGGRLDYIPGHTAATLIYNRRQHIIDLFTWPSGSEGDLPPSAGSRDGYNYLRWEQNGMSFWVVSDLDASELSAFVQEWRSR
jgi:anti-sigma factor RsiW